MLGRASSQIDDDSLDVTCMGEEVNGSDVISMCGASFFAKRVEATFSSDASFADNSLKFEAYNKHRKKY